MSKVKQTIKKNWILRNLFWGAVFLVGLLLTIRIALSIVTQHDITEQVPDFVKMDLDAARVIAEHSGMVLNVTDSVYVENFPKGAIFSQNPKAGTKVKRGRTIYLVTNAQNDKKVMMPDLVGFSLRQAQVEIAAAGLRSGKLMYVEDIATDNVLGQFINGNSATADSLVKAGSTVDLLLGLNPEDRYTAIPNVMGLRATKAISEIKSASLNIKTIYYDNTVKNASDSLRAFVYQVYPSYQELTRGTEISLFLTLDPLKLPVEEDDSESAADPGDAPSQEDEDSPEDEDSI